MLKKSVEIEYEPRSCGTQWKIPTPQGHHKHPPLVLWILSRRSRHSLPVTTATLAADLLQSVGTSSLLSHTHTHTYRLNGRRRWLHTCTKFCTPNTPSKHRIAQYQERVSPQSRTGFLAAKAFCRKHAGLFLWMFKVALYPLHLSCERVKPWVEVTPTNCLLFICLPTVLIWGFLRI